MEIHEWMTSTLATNIMTRDVIVFAHDDTLATAAEKLLKYQISGGPVLQEGNCVGVLSANDLVAAEEEVTKNRQDFAQSGFWVDGLSLPVHLYEEKLAAVQAKISPIAQQPVEKFMTADVVTVSEDATLDEIVQKLIDAHIHRVLVVDQTGQLKGIISSTDVLAGLHRESLTATSS